MRFAGARWASVTGAGLLLWACALAAPVDDWRQQATAARKLADNDASAAYVQAQDLQARLPPDATAADRAASAA